MTEGARIYGLFSVGVEDEQARVFGAERKVPKKPRKPKEGAAPPKPPRAWRDPKNGELLIDVPFHPGFNAALKASVDAARRYWVDDAKVWLVWASEALAVEDLLEAYYPDVLIDYQGWDPARDQHGIEVRAIPADPPPF